MSFIKDKIRAWRYGYTGVTGLNELQNNAKMIAVLIFPFIGLWFGAQYAIVTELVPEWLGPWLLMGVFGIWGAYCVGYWAYATTDANKYKGFPQTTCYFPDGGVVKYNFLVEPDGIREVCKFKDGGVGIEVTFTNRYLYQDRNMPFPYVFKKALWKLPSELGQAFKFLSSGEFWHKGIVVETPNCEHVSFYVMDWAEEFGEHKPIGLINDCSFTFDQALEGKEFPSPRVKHVDSPKTVKVSKGNPSNPHNLETFYMLYKSSLKREDELLKHTQTIEEALETSYKQSGKGFKKEMDKALSGVRDRVHLITDTSEPLWKKIFNFGMLWKAILIMIVLWGFLHFGLGVI